MKGTIETANLFHRSPAKFILRLSSWSSLLLLREEWGQRHTGHSTVVVSTQSCHMVDILSKSQLWPSRNLLIR